MESDRKPAPPRKSSTGTEDVRFHLVGKKDRRGDPYYTGFCIAPISIDMSNAVMFFFLDEEDPDNPERFGGELVIKRRREEPA